MEFGARAEKGDKVAGKEGQPAAGDATKKAEPLTVPDGSPEELIKFIKNLGDHPPENRDEQSMKEFAAKTGAAALIAAEKILAAKPTDEQAEIAVEVKCAVLSMRDQEGNAEAVRQLKEFAGKLEKAGRPKLARMAQACLLQQQIMKARAAEPEDLKKRIEEVKKFVAGGTVDVPEARLALAVIHVAERSDQSDLIVDLDRFFGKALASSGNKEIANLGKKLEGAATRLTLVGKAMPLEGSTLEGKPLEWEKYRGKIVLVDFWATWCGPCLQEMKNIRKQYEGYHEKGFDVVGVSVDEDRQWLESFVKREQGSLDGSHRPCLGERGGRQVNGNPLWRERYSGVYLGRQRWERPGPERARQGPGRLPGKAPRPQPRPKRIPRQKAERSPSRKKRRSEDRRLGGRENKCCLSLRESMQLSRSERRLYDSY